MNNMMDPLNDYMLILNLFVWIIPDHENQSMLITYVLFLTLSLFF
jgi:hypothetical protein